MFGAVSLDENITSRLIYRGLLSLQHRGQESSGISVLDKSNIHSKKFPGLVTDSIPLTLLPKFKGRMGVGHVRYSTVGSSGLRDAQPFMLDYPKHGLVLAHNGNTVNYMGLRKELNDAGRRLSSTCDAEVILNVLGEELSKTKDLEDAVLGVMERVEGSYSTVAFTGDKEFIAFRDPHGFRPFCYGENHESRIFASESVALEINNAKLKSDVNPGELIISDEEGKIEKKRSSSMQKMCTLYV